ncbi:hypothetical protein PTSG_10517 [Salpingoeca rosetta]|uniref:Uncharacterized protein n=1 Tax=Salpingoeca rosetta (strain ATCC 50818 / BSB-021) TaxID=946362 RepID=F2UPW3_SALR5|nr:uncharacterized protein PTSG_10517 [Salpingoeca rosetta]EGD79668.1 hypothetical protein PTSG_10517 [Salpingoeca rosetta]|eukprot:XP_004988896.1 hypothetical protein PTSG_10517 [Salpingoeca rosetta]
MLTCRELYHDLPWAMPRWCLAALLNRPRQSVWESKTFVDSFQRRLLSSLQGTRAAHKARAGQRRLPAAADTRMDDDWAVWLENRFLAYSWLGVTWDATCPFLRAQVRSVAAAPNSNNLWRKFQHCGRIFFCGLDKLEAWAADTQQASHATTQKPREERGAAHRAHRESGDKRDALMMQTQEPCAQQQTHVLETASHENQHKDLGTAHSMSTPTRAPTLTPAVFSLYASLNSQADAERFQGLRTTVFANARAEHVFIQAQAPLASLTVSNADNVHINACSAVIDNLVIRDVTRVVWLPATTQRSTACHLSNVQHIDLRTKSTLTEDLGAFAGIPSVGLATANDDTGVDLAPLHGVKQLELPTEGTEAVRGHSVFQAAETLVLSHTSLTPTDTLPVATVVKLSHMSAVPELLHLPNAIDIALGYGSKVRQFTCAPRVERLVIRDATGTPPCIPKFEHAQVVCLALPHLHLKSEQLVDLSNRVDKLVLRRLLRVPYDADSPHTSTSVVRGIPNHAHVCLDCFEIDGPVPPCVKELQALLEGSALQGSFVSHVPRLSLNDKRGHTRINDVHLLSGRKVLQLMQVLLEGQLASCEQLSLCGCRGRLGLTSIGSLDLNGAVVTTEDGNGDGDTNIDSGDGSDDSDNRALAETKLVITRVHHVTLCRLEECDIHDFGCFQDVQHLTLKECTFKDLASFPPVHVLFLRNCETMDEDGWCPDAVFVDRSPNEMEQLLLAERRRCRAMGARSINGNVLRNASHVHGCTGHLAHPPQSWLHGDAWTMYAHTVDALPTCGRTTVCVSVLAASG